MDHVEVVHIQQSADDTNQLRKLARIPKKDGYNSQAQNGSLRDVPCD